MLRVFKVDPRKVGRVLLVAVLSYGMFVCMLTEPLSASAPPARPRHAPTPNPPVVINFQIIAASRAARILRGLYPDARIRVDSRANAVIVVAPGYEENGMRTIAQGIDVKNPTSTVVDTVQLHVLSPRTVQERLAAVFPSARVLVAPNRNVIVMASPSDLSQIKGVIAAIDTAPPTPTPRPHYPAQAVRVTQRNAQTIARAVAAESPGVRVAVSRSEILLSGPSDEVTQAKQLVRELDVPQMGTQYTQVYRLRYVDAASVADLLRRSFNNLTLAVNGDLNAITVTSNLSVQQRIADALDQLDLPPPGAPGADGQANAGPAGSGITVVKLRAAVPGLQGGPSTSAADIAQTVTQALQTLAPDLHVVVPANSTELVLTGSPYSIKLAKELIAKLDVRPTMVALDTEVLEVDEGVQKQLGLQFPTSAISSTFTEVPPVYPGGSSQAGAQIPYLNLMPLIRSPISLQAELNFLVANNKARILEDPRLTTISGRTASLRAGETVNILTTTGGGTGTVATTQVQSFQTGVTLDITPVVNAGNYITVTLHPSVNSIAAISAAGVPNIQTRDTTTTVGLRDGQTIVIGGLIEDLRQRTTQKIPLLGDIPLLGPILFQYHGINRTRNELIVTVTPHILRPGESGALGGEHLAIPRPGPLPTLSPRTILPAVRVGHIPGRGRFGMPPSPAPEPRPVRVPLPLARPTAVPTPAPGTATPKPGALQPTTPPSGSLPVVSTASPTPAPLPTAFSQTNVYTFGAAPANNYVPQNAPPQIFYAQVSPSVVRSGQSMTLSAITTTNVAKLTFGPSGITPLATLQSIAPGQWQATFSFSSAGLPIGQGNVTLMLTATNGFGATVALPVPLSVVNP